MAMVTDTEQREREVSQVAEASSRLGEIEGQVKLLVRRTEENARNAREDYRALDGKIDRTAKELIDRIDGTDKSLDGKIDRSVKDLGDKIDSTSKVLDGKIDRNFKELDGKIDRSVKDLGDKIDQTAADMRAEMRRLQYWVFGTGGVVVAAIIIERFVS